LSHSTEILRTQSTHTVRAGRPGREGIMRAAVPLLAVAALAGCATGGLNRTGLVPRMQSEPLQVNDDEIKQALALKPQLSFPCRVAFYFDPAGCGSWHWTARDKDLLRQVAESLHQDGVVTDFVPLSPSFAGGGTLKDLRVAAAKYGADALFVVKGVAQSRKTLNPAAVLNLTVVGGFIAPGSTCDAVFRMEGLLIDVSNGFLYATVESEGEGWTVGPTFVAEGDWAVERAKRRAVESFGPELVQRVRGLCRWRAAAPAPAVLPLGGAVTEQPKPAVRRAGWWFSTP